MSGTHSMENKLTKSPNCPEGLEFLKLAAEQEDACEKHSRTRLLKMGQKAPECLENLGTVLSLLDRVASCFWGCRGGDHLVEYLAGRVSASARSSLRLLYFGFYDESLSITRGIGEAANLLFLFMKDIQIFEEWRLSSKKERLSNFSPVKVRLHLERLGLPVPIDEARYSQLCEIATHVTPQTKPQAHNPPLGMPLIGGYFQEGGGLVALNELAAATSLATIALPKLLNLQEDKQKRICEVCLVLLKSVGGVNVLTVKDMWQKVLNDSLSSSAGKSKGNA